MIRKDGKWENMGIFKGLYWERWETGFWKKHTIFAGEAKLGEAFMGQY